MSEHDLASVETVAAILKELGHPARLRIYKELVKAGHDGLPVGQLRERLQIPGSTLSHHISALVSVGLVKQIREGRILHCVSQYDVLESIIAFLQDECCATPADCAALPATLSPISEKTRKPTN